MRSEAGGLRMRVRAWVLIVLTVAALVVPMAAQPGAVLAAPGVASITYPTWAQVKAARASTTKAKKQIAAIKAVIAQLEAALKAAQADEVAKGEAFETAQNAYDAQVMVADDLRTQADTAGEQAKTAKKQANRLIAQLSKTGNGDVVADLLANSSDADSLLYKLEAMDRLSVQSNDIYAEALKLQNNAQSLADQADVAEAKRDELKNLAAKALDAARAATEAADKAVQEQQDHQAELEAMLDVLIKKREATERDYQAGVIAREKARQAALKAAQEAAGQAGTVNALGWSRPSTGYISSGFGMRYHPIYHRWLLHSGTDIAGQGCGAPIHAAHYGFVTYAGWNGTLGNYIQIDHENGTSSGYGHIVNGGILVRYGQFVHAGQVIARVGTTGASTGCHLHFIIRVNGQLTNPVPFMRNRGILLG